MTVNVDANKPTTVIGIDPFCHNDEIQSLFLPSSLEREREVGSRASQTPFWFESLG